MAARKQTTSITQGRSKFAKHLNQMQGEWDKSVNNHTESVDDVPDGEYIARCNYAAIKVNDETGAVRCSRGFMLTEGDYENSTIFDSQNLGNDVGKDIFITWLKRCGKEPPTKFVDIEGTLEEIVRESLPCRLRVRHKDEYMNINVVEVYDAEDDTREPESAEPESAEPDVDELDDLDRNGLKKYIKEQELDITVYKSMSEDDIRTAIRTSLEAEAEAEAEDEDEAEAEAEEPETEGNIPTDEELAARVYDFAKRSSIKEIKKTQSLDEMLEILAQYEFTETEETEEDVELLKMVDLAECLI